MGGALRCCWLVPPQEAEVFVNGVSLGRTGDLSKPPSGGCEAYLLYRSFAVPAGVLSTSRPNVVAVRVRSGSDASRPGGLYDSMAPDMRSGEPAAFIVEPPHID